MKKHAFPLFLLFLFLLNNGVGFLMEDSQRADLLREKSEVISKEELKKQQVKKKDSVEDPTFMDYSGIEIPELEEVKNAPSIDYDHLAGTITIDSIALSLNILIGTNQVNMYYGATTGLVNQKMGKSNYVLFGHNMQSEGVLFSDLKEVKKQDTIVLTDFDGSVYTYEVTESKVIKATDLSVIKESDQPIVTLITCSTVDLEGKKVMAGSTPYRLMVRGKLIETKGESNAS